jgi:hypothetical protein
MKLYELLKQNNVIVVERELLLENLETTLLKQNKNSFKVRVKTFCEMIGEICKWYSFNYTFNK